MKSNLERFQMTKLRPFQEKIQRQYLSTNVSFWGLDLFLRVNTRQHFLCLTFFPTCPQLTGHLEEMLQAAYNKFHAWQTRRMMRKTWGLMSWKTTRKTSKYLNMCPENCPVIDIVHRDLMMGMQMDTAKSSSILQTHYISVTNNSFLFFVMDERLLMLMV